MRGAAATVALEQLANFHERERKDDAFRLGELERALQRGSDRAPIAALLVRQGIEKQRLDHDHAGWSARAEPSMTGASLSIARSGRPSSHSMAAAVIRISARPRACGSRPASAARTPAVSPIWICVRNARLRRSSVKLMSLSGATLDPLRGSHRRERVVEPPLCEQEERPPVVQEQLHARGPTRRQRGLRAPQPSLRLREAPQPGERATPHGKGRGNLVMGVPSMRLGERGGLLGQLAGNVTGRPPSGAARAR